MPEEGAPEKEHEGHDGEVTTVIVRPYEEEMKYIERLTPEKFRIKKGFVPNMNVEGVFYINKDLEDLILGELRDHCKSAASGYGGFLPAVKQIANVAALPGIVKRSIGLPDVHSGYGFAIGNVAAFDLADPESVVSPGGVGFDINCGVRDYLYLSINGGGCFSHVRIFICLLRVSFGSAKPVLPPPQLYAQSTTLNTSY